MSTDLKPGPEMDAALARLMEIEPSAWRIRKKNSGAAGPFKTEQRARFELPSYPGGVVVPVYPALSTTDEGMGRVLDWLEQQGWYYQELRRANQSGPHWFCTLGKGDTFVDGPYSSTRFEAVGRAALLTKGERDGDG